MILVGVCLGPVKVFGSITGTSGGTTARLTVVMFAAKASTSARRSQYHQAEEAIETEPAPGKSADPLPKGRISSWAAVCPLCSNGSELPSIRAAMRASK